MNPFDLDSIIGQKLNAQKNNTQYSTQYNMQNETQPRTQNEILTGGRDKKTKNVIKSNIKKERPATNATNGRAVKPNVNDNFTQRYEEIQLDAANLGDYLRFSTEERNGDPTIGGVLKKITDNPDGSRTLSIRIKRGNSYTWLNYNSAGIKKVYRFLKNDTPSSNTNEAKGISKTVYKNMNSEEKSNIERIGEQLLFGDNSDRNKKLIEELTTRVQALETELANLKTNLKTIFPVIKRGAEAYDILVKNKTSQNPAI